MWLISVYLTISSITNYSYTCINTKIMNIFLPHLSKFTKEWLIIFHLPKIRTSVVCDPYYGLFHQTPLFPALVQCSDFKTCFRGSLRALIANIYEMMASWLVLYKISPIKEILKFMCTFVEGNYHRPIDSQQNYLILKISQEMFLFV